MRISVNSKGLVVDVAPASARKDDERQIDVDATVYATLVAAGDLNGDDGLPKFRFDRNTNKLSRVKAGAK